MTEATKKRKVIKSEGREIIARVYHFLHNEYHFMKMNNHDKCDLSPLAKIKSRTAEATGVSRHTVFKILQEEKNLAATNGQFVSPTEKRRKRASKLDFDSFNTDLIRSTVANYRKDFNEEPTLKKLKAILQKRVGFEGCLSSLRKLLYKVGYKYQQVNGKRVLREIKKKKIKESKSNSKPIETTAQKTVVDNRMTGGYETAGVAGHSWNYNMKNNPPQDTVMYQPMDQPMEKKVEEYKEPINVAVNNVAKMKKEKDESLYRMGLPQCFRMKVEKMDPIRK